MSDMVLVTGGCGFIGSNLVARLVESGYNVRILDNLLRGSESNLSDHFDQSTIELIRGDIRDQEVVNEAVNDTDYVVHLAATNLNRSISYPSESLHVNIIGTNNVLQAAIEHDVEKFLFASSASVYGNQDAPMRESDHPQPQTPYGIAKLAGEGLLRFYATQHNLDYLAFRFFNVYGAGQDTDAYYTSVINVFIERLARGEPPVVDGSGDQSMDFVNINDLARALHLGIESDTSNDIFNIGSGDSTTIATLAEMLIDIMDADIEPQYKDRDVLVSERRAATEHAQTELGFQTEIPLKDGLKNVVDYVLKEMGKTN